MIFHSQYPPLVTGLLLVAAVFLADAVPARAQLRIVTYNTANGSFDGNNISPRTGMDIVLEAIGNEVTGGIARPIDALILQEQDDPATSTQAFVDLLNGIYGAGTYGRSTVLNGPSLSSIHQTLVYNTSTLQLVSEQAFGFTGGANAARQPVRYQLRPFGYDSSADFYVYNNHYKAGGASDPSNGTTVGVRRNNEAIATRTNADALGDGAHIIYAGDYNIQSSSEAMYQTLLSAGNGQAFDPLSSPGRWNNNSSYAPLHTQSPHDGSDGLVTFGLDDRFDFQLVTGELLDNEGLSYLPGSYHALGNNGTTYNQAVNVVSNTYPLTSGQLDALAHVSDHLPVVADYQLPAIMNAWLATVPPNVSQGALVNVDVLVENIANVPTASGADELDYTLSVSGDLFGGTSGIDLALGGGNTHQVTLDTSTEGLRDGTITVSSSSQSVGNPLLTFPVSFTVGPGGGPVFGVIAKDDFDGQINRNSYSQSPAAGTYSNAGDGFEAYQVGVSATIPFQLVDDSAAAGDSLGIVDSATKADIWFGVTDTVNDDNIPADNPGTATATWEFDITGATGLRVSIDMGAMGDFESANDRFHWTYALDGNPAAPLFTSSVNEAGLASYIMAGGAVVNLDDPLQMTDTSGATTELSNVFQTFISPLIGTGDTLTVELIASTDGGSEAYAFDNIIVKGFTGSSFLEADFNEDGDVDAADLAQWRGDFGNDNGSDADGDGDSDGADFLVWQRQFGMSTHPTALSQVVPEPTTLLLLGFASAWVFWSRLRASERSGRSKRQCFPPKGRFSCLLGVLLVLPTVVLADPYDPPAGYYNSATGTGPTLKSQLTTIMSTEHIQRTYGDFRYSAAITDADPDNPGNILLAYNRASVSGVWNLGGLLPWNREHVWPQSRQPGSANNSTTGNLGDPHALRPADTNINADRGDKPFGFEDTTGSYRSLGSYFFPGDADQGDIARQLFYSDTRYASSGLSLTDSFPTGYQMGDLSSLIAWHYLDPPDEFERRRNQAIYSASMNPSYYTNIRNAYIDRPEYAWSVYVDQQNDSRLYVGSDPAADGNSTLDIDLGAVLVGASVPSAQNVTLQKSGFDGTYYELTSSGDAVLSATGRYQAFALNDTGSDSRALTIGLETSTLTAGPRGGTVTIDNLDITTGGGTGRGENDGNDLLNVTLDVLDHANASFSGGTDLNTHLLDLGTFTLNSISPTLDFDLFNLEATNGFTADLELDSIFGTGDTSILTTNLAPLTGASALAAGLSNTFTATFDTSTVGDYSASYTLSFSDEDLPGASPLADLLLTITGTIENTTVETADFDLDTDVDGTDLLAWQRNLGATNAERWQGDANGDSVVDASDLTLWGEQFGMENPGSVASVPEPASLALALFMLFLARGKKITAETAPRRGQER